MDGSTNPASPEGNTAGNEEIRNEALPASEASPANDLGCEPTQSVLGRAPGTPPPRVTPEDRIQELREQSLQDPSPLISAVKTAGSDLLSLQRAVLNVITEMIRTDRDPLGAIGDAAPHVSLALKVGNQWLQVLAFAERLQRQKGVPPPSE